MHIFLYGVWKTDSVNQCPIFQVRKVALPQDLLAGEVFLFFVPPCEPSAFIAQNVFLSRGALTAHLNQSCYLLATQSHGLILDCHKVLRVHLGSALN